MNGNRNHKLIDVIDIIELRIEKHEGEIKRLIMESGVRLERVNREYLFNTYEIDRHEENDFHRLHTRQKALHKMEELQLKLEKECLPHYEEIDYLREIRDKLLKDQKEDQEILTGVVDYLKDIQDIA